MKFNFDQPKNVFQKVEEVPCERAVSSEESDFDIYADADNVEEVKRRIEVALQQRHWWLCPEWQKQGLPKEQFEFGDIKVFNFLRLLTQEEKNEIEKSLQFVSRIKKDLLTTLEYVVISSDDGFNSQSGKKFLGFSRDEQKIIRLHPETFSRERDRRIPEISNLELVVTHEPIHHVINKNRNILKKWSEEFEWTLNDDPAQLMGDGVTKKTFMTKHPERCITDYAQVDADEDMCESFSASYANIDRLDSEKAEFLKKHIFEESDQNHSIVSVPVKLPQVEKVKYFIRKPIKISIKPKNK